MKLYHNESWELMIRRWSKLLKDFRLKNSQFDISKIPDIYDCIKYDLQHNIKVLRFKEADHLHNISKAMADIVIPQVYNVSAYSMTNLVVSHRSSPSHTTFTQGNLVAFDISHRSSTSHTTFTPGNLVASDISHRSPPSHTTFTPGNIVVSDISYKSPLSQTTFTLMGQSCSI